MLDLRIPPLLLVVLVAALMWVAAFALPPLTIPVPGAAVIAAVLVLAGFVVAGAGVIGFRRARTTVNPLEPERASALVVTGVYRHTRNPMYVGFALALLGWAAYLSNLGALLLVGGFVLYMNRFQIRFEERALEKAFGADYAAYRARTRRWI